MATPFIEEISPGIWQANAEGAMLAYQNPKMMEERRLGGIVNVAHDIEQDYPGVPSLRLHMKDWELVPLYWFDQAVEFQKRLSGENKATLVHCRAGINRSSAVIVVMMVAWGRSVPDAIEKLPRKPYTQQMYDSIWSWARARGR